MNDDSSGSSIPPFSYDDVTLSTHVFSNFFTSALKFSTSCQQSSGRRSCSRRHWMTLLRAPSTLSGRSRTFFRSSSLRRSSSTSLPSEKLVMLLSSAVGSEPAIFSCAKLRASDSLVWSLFSSSATRAWTCCSISLAREASVYR